ncbi:hypothetical protein FACS189468_6270 [Spirochaetia bacterium]|nr:hypothetical protein FACS189468_6270 [Spirochaetia bacterium]
MTPEPDESEISQESAAPEEPEKKLSREELLDLLHYLKGLTDFLPEKKRETFMQSNARLSLDYVIDVLEGRKGLDQETEAPLPVPAPGTPAEEAGTTGAPKPVELAGTLAYLGELASTLPGSDLAALITRKIDTIMTEIR